MTLVIPHLRLLTRRSKAPFKTRLSLLFGSLVSSCSKFQMTKRLDHILKLSYRGPTAGRHEGGPSPDRA
jgi:hypothetical protein